MHYHYSLAEHLQMISYPIFSVYYSANVFVFYLVVLCWMMLLVLDYCVHIYNRDHPVIYRWHTMMLLIHHRLRCHCYPRTMMRMTMMMMVNLNHHLIFYAFLPSYNIYGTLFGYLLTDDLSLVHLCDQLNLYHLTILMVN